MGRSRVFPNLLAYEALQTSGKGPKNARTPVLGMTFAASLPQKDLTFGSRKLSWRGFHGSVSMNAACTRAAWRRAYSRASATRHVIP